MEDDEEEGLSLFTPALTEPRELLLLLVLVLVAIGGFVRDERALAGTSGGHSFPSRAGGGPVRRRTSEDFLALARGAHLGTSALLFSRWAII